MVGSQFASRPSLKCRFSNQDTFQETNAQRVTSSLITCVTPKRDEEGTTIVEISSNGIGFSYDDDTLCQFVGRSIPAVIANSSLVHCRVPPMSNVVPMSSDKDQSLHADKDTKRSIAFKLMVNGNLRQNAGR